MVWSVPSAVKNLKADFKQIRHIPSDTKGSISISICRICLKSAFRFLTVLSFSVMVCNISDWSFSDTGWLFCGKTGLIVKIRKEIVKNNLLKHQFLSIKIAINFDSNPPLYSHLCKQRGARGGS